MITKTFAIVGVLNCGTRTKQALYAQCEDRYPSRSSTADRMLFYDISADYGRASDSVLQGDLFGSLKLVHTERRVASGPKEQAAR